MGEKVRAVGDHDGNRMNRAVAIQRPVNLPTWGHFAVTTGTFQDEGISESLAMARAGHRMLVADYRDTYKQPLVRDEHKMLAVATLKGPASGTVRGFIPRTQLFGATAAGVRYNTVSMVLATMAARRLRIPRLGFSEDFGRLTTEYTIQDALRRFVPLNDILGFDLKAGKSERGARLESVGLPVRLVVADSGRRAHLSISQDRVEKASDEIK